MRSGGGAARTRARHVRAGRAAVLLVGLGLLTMAGGALAGPPAAPPSPTPQVAAGKVLKAVGAKDDAALMALAVEEEPDPWLVADVLVARGERDAAAAFARTAARKDTEGLPGYLDSLKGQPDDPTMRTALAAAQAAAERPAEALAALGDPPPDGAARVVRIEMEHARGLALRGLRRNRESALAFERAGRAAQSVGWLRKAGHALRERGNSLFRDGDYPATLKSCQETIALEESRGDPVGLGKVTSNLGQVLSALGKHGEALASFQKAVSLLERTSDRRALALTLDNLGAAHSHLGEPAEALTVGARALKLGEELADEGVIASVLTNMGVAHARRGEMDQALPLYARALEIRRRLGPRTVVASLLGNVGAANHARGEFDEAMDRFEEALKICEQDGDRPGIARTMTQISSVSYARKEYQAALDQLGQALAIHESMGREADAAEVLGQMAMAQDALGRHAEALQNYRKVLAISQRSGDAGNVARTLGNMAYTYDTLGDYARAQEYGERALEAMRDMGDRAGEARMLAQLANVDYARGQYAEALKKYETALAAQRTQRALRAVAGILSDMGRVSVSMGDYAKALERYDEAKALFESMGLPGQVAVVLGNVGTVHELRGDYAKALDLHARVLRMAQAQGDKSVEIGALARLGTDYGRMGQTTRALDHLKRALALSEQAGYEAAIPRAMLDLGNVYVSMGRLSQALDLYEQSLRRSEKTGDKHGVAIAFDGLGVVHGALGDVDRALEFHLKALAIQESLGEKASAATTLMNVGMMHRRRGDLVKSRDFYARSLEALRALGERGSLPYALRGSAYVEGELRGAAAALPLLTEALTLDHALGDRAGEAVDLADLGVTSAEGGDLAQARTYLDRSVAEAERIRADLTLVYALEHSARTWLAAGDVRAALGDARRGVGVLEHVLGDLGDEQGSRARARYRGLFGVGLAAAARAGDAGALCYFLESGRAGALMEALGGRQALRWEGLPEELRAAEASARAGATGALAEYRAALASGDEPRIAAADAALGAARKAVDDVFARIQRGAKRAASVFYPRAATLEEVSGWLAPEEAFVAYGFGEEEAVALVVTSEGGRIVRLGLESAVADACAALRVDVIGVDVAPGLTALTQLVVEPLKLGPAVRRVIVSPDGPLTYVPIGTLLPDRDVAFAPSATTYGHLLEERRGLGGNGARGTLVLALGDPDYAQAFDPNAAFVFGPARPDRPLRPLPGTRAEAMSVGDQKLLGKEASETGLRAALAAGPTRWRSVHFACHGWVSPENPTRCSIVLTPDATHDGFLTAREVLDLEISADLVVLSACDTGRGRVVPGEGIVGLTRAFMFAGAPRTIVSLWMVDDEATAALMTKFYALWHPRDGSPSVPPAAALRAAQEHVRSIPRWRHPFFWAAWVLWGLPTE